MPLLLLLVGIVLIVAGYKKTVGTVVSQLASDFKGFIALGVVITIVGYVGVIKELRPASNAFLVLIFVVFFLRNGNRITQGLTSSVLNKSTQ